MRAVILMPARGHDAERSGLLAMLRRCGVAVVEAGTPSEVLWAIERRASVVIGIVVDLRDCTASRVDLLRYLRDHYLTIVRIALVADPEIHVDEDCLRIKPADASALSSILGLVLPTDAPG